MAKNESRARVSTNETSSEAAPTKAELERQMEEARESITHTVAEIKDTVTEQYETVKETVSGVLDFREQFKDDPLVWSLGALSAGFALGYTLGYAHKNTQASGDKHSQIAAYAETIADQLSTVGQSLVMPTLNLKIKELFGFDFSKLLEELNDTHKAAPKRKTVKKIGTKKSAAKKGTARKSSKK